MDAHDLSRLPGAILLTGTTLHDYSDTKPDTMRATYRQRRAMWREFPDGGLDGSELSDSSVFRPSGGWKRDG
jgi:hypothetical protein